MDISAVIEELFPQMMENIASFNSLLSEWSEFQRGMGVFSQLDLFN